MPRPVPAPTPRSTFDAALDEASGAAPVSPGAPGRLARPAYRPRAGVVTAVLVTLGLLAAGEAAVRGTGWLDFPLFVADARVGYVPAPDQAGRWRLRSDWQFNGLGMAGPAFAPSATTPNLLLLGEGGVLGWRHPRSTDRLGPQLARASRQAVWPMSAPGWTLRNQLAWLRRHPEVVDQVDRVVLVLGSGDFVEARSWACDLTHPLQKPVLGLWYLLRQQLTDPAGCGETPSALRVPPGDWQADLRAWAAEQPPAMHKLSVFLYPNRQESQLTAALAQNLERQAGAIARAAGRPVPVYSVGRDVRWQPLLYRDNLLPTEAGTAVLAAVMASPGAAGWRLQP